MSIQGTSLSPKALPSDRRMTADETGHYTQRALNDLKRLGLSLENGVLTLPDNATVERNGIDRDISFVRIQIPGKPEALIPAQLFQDHHIRIEGGRTDGFETAGKEAKNPIPREHFFAAEYMRSNPDVAEHWRAGRLYPGTTLEQAAQRHYDEFGRNENRQIKLSASEYLEKYPDVAQWAQNVMDRKAGDPNYVTPGNPPARTLQDLARYHSLAFGQNEGRPAIDDKLPNAAIQITPGGVAIRLDTGHGSTSVDVNGNGVSVQLENGTGASANLTAGTFNGLNQSLYIKG